MPWGGVRAGAVLRLCDRAAPGTVAIMTDHDDAVLSFSLEPPVDTGYAKGFRVVVVQPGAAGTGPTPEQGKLYLSVDDDGRLVLADGAPGPADRLLWVFTTRVLDDTATNPSEVAVWNGAFRTSGWTTPTGSVAVAEGGVLRVVTTVDPAAAAPWIVVPR